MIPASSTVKAQGAVVSLRAGGLRVDASPAFGGRILRFSTEAARPTQWLVPIEPAAAAVGKHVRGGCFPLVPFSNRIRDARLSWNGRCVPIGADPLGAPHAMHGQGWRRPWEVLEQTSDRLAMRLVHPSDANWPFDYEAIQTVQLRPDALKLTLQLRCIGVDPMPAGIGWHPYFPWRGGLRLGARATRDWPLGADLMPTRSVAIPTERCDGLQPPSHRKALAHATSGWNGHAMLSWNRGGRALSLNASRSLRHAIVFMPGDAPLFCVEPASHTIDAFNLAALGVRGTGARILRPGESLRGHLVLRPIQP